MAKNKQNTNENQEIMQENNTVNDVQNQDFNEKQQIDVSDETEQVNEKSDLDVQEDAADNQNMEVNADNEAENVKSDDELAKMTLQFDEMKDKYLRLSAEFDNYRKRTLKEKMELTKSAGEGILLNILPVVDNFERALKSLEASKDIDAVKEGIHLIYGTFMDFLKQQGIKSMEAVNLEFNTDEHEAITKIPAPTNELKGKVIDVVEKGYKLHDKVIRFAKVVVGE